MQITRFAAMIVALAGIAACQPQGNPLKTPQTCGAEQLQALIGLPAKEVDFTDHKGPLRLIGPEDAYTEDHRPERLNVFKDTNGTITKITCG